MQVKTLERQQWIKPKLRGKEIIGGNQWNTNRKTIENSMRAKVSFLKTSV